MRQKRIWITIIIGLIIIALVWVWIIKSGKKGQEVYKIGAILPLTGNLATIGEPERNALILAEEKINSEGGINGEKLRVVIEDSKGEAKEAVTIASKFLNVDGIKIFIVSTSPSILATIPIIRDKEGIMFAITSTPGITDGTNIFRLSPDSGQEMELLYEFFKERNIKKVAFSYPNNEFGNIIKDIFSKLYNGYGTIIIDDAYQVGGKDFRSLIVKFKQYNPEWISFQGYPGDIPIFIKQARESGLTSKFITSMATTWPSTVRALSEMDESPIFMAPLVNVAQLRPKESNDFARAYEERFGFSPNWDAFYTYDTAMLIAEVFRKSEQASVNKFRGALRAIKKFSGVAGPIELLPNGDIKAALIPATIKNGKIVQVK